MAGYNNHVHDWTKSSIFLINSNMGMCSQSVYTGTGPWTHAWCLSPPRFRGNVGWTCFFYWSLCANDSQLIWKLAWHSNTTYPKHLPLEFLVGHVLVSLSPCGRCTIAHHCLKLQSFPKIHKIMVFKICELIWVGILSLFWMSATFCHLKMIGVEVWLKT